MSPILSTFSLGLFRGAAQELTLEYIASAFSTTHQITVPATAQADDLVVICWMGRSPWLNSSGLSLPSGWTRINSADTEFFPDDDLGMDFFYKKIVSGDVSTTINCAPSGWTTDVNSLIVIRPSETATFAVDSSNLQVAAANPTAQTLDGTATVTPHVSLAFYKSGAAIAPRTESSGTFTELTGSTSNYIKYRIFNKDSDRLSTSIDMDDEGWNGLASCIITAQV